MRRYYFDLEFNSEMKKDLEGLEFADEKAARREAVTALADMAAEAIPQDGPLAVAISVRDDRNIRMFQARVTFDFDGDEDRA